MNGLNAEFTGSPVAFLKKYTIDNVQWERGVENAKLLAALSGAKHGLFDFMPGSGNSVIFRTVAAAKDVKKDTPIDAYYCPFDAGSSSVGHVDLPGSNPPYKFAFTPAMHGCAFHVTTNNGGSTVRLWHNQHPGSSTDALITGSQISTLTYADYAGDYDERAAKTKNAFNCLFYVAGVWHYLSQATFINADLSGVTRNTDIPVLLRGASH